MDTLHDSLGTSKSIRLFVKAFILATGIALCLTATPAWAAHEGNTARCSTLTAGEVGVQSGLSAMAGSSSYQKYVGKYTRLVYTSEPTPSYVGVLPTGSLYSKRQLVIRAAKPGKVRLMVAYSNAWMANVAKTKWTTAKVKNGKGSFTYQTNQGERGKGRLQFLKNKRVKLWLKTTYRPTLPVQTISLDKGIVMKYGTEKLY